MGAGLAYPAAVRRRSAAEKFGGFAQSAKEERMRKALLFTVASAMIVGRAYLLLAEFFWATVIYFKAVLGGSALVVLGGYLLWEDFIAPVLGIEVKK